MLPSPKEVSEGLSPSDWSEEELEEALDLSIRTVELIGQINIRRRTLKEVLINAQGTYALSEYPVQNVTVNGLSVYGDEKNGIIQIEEANNQEHHFKYDVGFTKNQVPALISRAVKNLARYLLTKDQYYLDELLTELAVIRFDRETAARLRPSCP